MSSKALIVNVITCAAGDNFSLLKEISKGLGRETLLSTMLIMFDISPAELWSVMLDESNYIFSSVGPHVRVNYLRIRVFAIFFSKS